MALEQHCRRVPLVIDRRRYLRLAGAAALAPAFGIAARAQPIIYPDHPVYMVVPFAPSTLVDEIGRVVASRLADMWGEKVVVENRKGANGDIAAEVVRHAAPDAYTLLLASIGFAINGYLSHKDDYDPVGDFAPVSLICSYPHLMTVPLSSPARTVQEFITYARESTRRLTFASASLGTSSYLAGELLKRTAHIAMTHVPYPGPGQAFNDVMAGRVDVMFPSASVGLPLVRSGKLRALAIASEKRAPWAPNIPTFAESGLPGFTVASWYALFAPARTPPEIIDKISADVAQVVRAPEFAAALDKIALTAAGVAVTPVGSTPEELGRYLKAELDKWGPVIAAAQMKANE
jgi:tripartite-type tricarboxylate transporter receptor subunit TctC